MLDLTNKNQNEENLVVPLSKAIKVSLKKNDVNLKNIQVGLKWKRNPNSKRISEDFDADLSVFMLSANGRVKKATDFVYFGNYHGTDGAIEHLGDNTTGTDDGSDAEQININLDKIPSYVEKLLFIVTVYESVERGQTFGLMEDALLIIKEVSAKDPLRRYDLTEDYTTSTALRACELSRKGDGWEFNPLGISSKEEIADICPMYGITPE